MANLSDVVSLVVGSIVERCCVGLPHLFLPHLLLLQRVAYVGAVVVRQVIEGCVGFDWRRWGLETLGEPLNDGGVSVEVEN